MFLFQPLLTFLSNVNKARLFLLNQAAPIIDLTFCKALVRKFRWDCRVLRWILCNNVSYEERTRPKDVVRPAVVLQAIRWILRNNILREERMRAQDVEQLSTVLKTLFCTPPPYLLLENLLKSTYRDYIYLSMLGYPSGTQFAYIRLPAGVRGYLYYNIVWLGIINKRFPLRNFRIKILGLTLRLSILTYVGLHHRFNKKLPSTDHTSKWQTNFKALSYYVTSNWSNYKIVWFESFVGQQKTSKFYSKLDKDSLVSKLKLDFLFKKYLLNSSVDLRKQILDVFSRSFGFGFIHLHGLIFLLIIDACLTDDEPLWEPIEWSLVQSWILITFVFAWIAENLIASRYGSYTGRDKRVWFAWYKTFWWVEGYYMFNYGVVCMFIIVPFYYETNYNLSFIYSWWHWYSRVFFFKFISVYTLILLTAYFLQLNIRWLDWKKSLLLILIINVFLSYLLYTHFIITFFAYFTDPTWYQKTRSVDYVQLSHEPARWGWGPAKKDHFTYHGVKTVLWFKNDGPFATSFLLFQTFLFVCLFTLYIYWITLFRRVYSTHEVPLTLTTYCVSSLKQFSYLFLFIYIFIFFSYISNYARFPVEFLWSLDTISWCQNLFSIIAGYPEFVVLFFLS